MRVTPRQPPLHRALRKDRPLAEIVAHLVSNDPHIASMSDADDLLPLHRAQRQASIFREVDNEWNKIMEVLVRAFPRALRIPHNQDNRTPLVYACESGQSLSTIFSLVREWPEQVTPIHSETVFGRQHCGHYDR